MDNAGARESNDGVWWTLQLIKSQQRGIYSDTPPSACVSCRTSVHNILTELEHGCDEVRAGGYIKVIV